MASQNSQNSRDLAHLNRRSFVQAIGAASLAGAGLPQALADQAVGPKRTDSAESAVGRLFKSMNDEQRKILCFPFDHPLRTRIGNNWAITKPKIEDLKPEQQELCREIFKNLTSEEGYERYMKQMDDDYGGFEGYHIAIFGEPDSDKPFEWVLSGRHDTLRADGNSADGVAFGGPIFYGHAAAGNFDENPTHTANVWWYQGEMANKIFKTLDDKQQAAALLDKKIADDARSIKLAGAALPESGLAIKSLDGQQKAMVKQLIEAGTRPFRKADVEELMSNVESAGGVDAMRLTFYKEGDIGGDGVWDVWKLEGPAFSWYFHGHPHVHTWLNVAKDAKFDKSHG
ncbi:DUF3500 domain-containing protein [bacterium]|nr:DUF3500 domain-containing protein [bacterium]